MIFVLQDRYHLTSMAEIHAQNHGFRRPLGLALSGGGALGSWQAGVLSALEKKFRLSFDSIACFSAGALNGAAFALGMIDTALERWEKIKENKILKFSPHLFPLSIFSNAPIFSNANYALDEEKARKSLRSKLTVLSLSKDRQKRVEKIFEPNGGRWDGPLASWLVASSSIPVIFPPVKLSHQGQEDFFIDAGVSSPEPMSFKALAGCQDIIVLEMIRADEALRSPKGFLRRIDHANRLEVRGFIDEGIRSLQELSPRPRIFRLDPSETLEFGMLEFTSPKILEAIRLGEKDAETLVQKAENFIAGSID